MILFLQLSIQHLREAETETGTQIEELYNLTHLKKLNEITHKVLHTPLTDLILEKEIGIILIS